MNFKKEKTFKNKGLYLRRNLQKLLLVSGCHEFLAAISASAIVFVKK